MRDEIRNRFMKYFTAVVVFAVIAVGGMTAYPTFCRGQRLKEEKAELQRQIEMKKREIAQLSENQRRFRTDPDFVETIARQNRRVYPGELVFIFED